MRLVPLKVKIRLKDHKGQTTHAFPPFNQLGPEIIGDVDWSYYVERHGGWFYDRLSGHKDHDADSPQGEWHGMILVPRDFADAALSQFPDQVERLTDAQAQQFYEARVTVNQPNEFTDADALKEIAARRDAGLEDNEDVQNALDPEHPALGVRKNRMKTWAGLKATRDVEVE